VARWLDFSLRNCRGSLEIESVRCELDLRRDLLVLEGGLLRRHDSSLVRRDLELQAARPKQADQEAPHEETTLVHVFDDGLSISYLYWIPSYKGERVPHLVTLFLRLILQFCWLPLLLLPPFGSNCHQCGQRSLYLQKARRKKFQG